jgi:hypothetical protein
LYREVHPGAIYFQHHGELGIRYRNLRIKSFTDDLNPWDDSPILIGNELVDELSHEQNVFTYGCMDILFEEYDPLVQVHDQELCLTPITGTARALKERRISIEQSPGMATVRFPFGQVRRAAVQDASGRVVGSFDAEGRTELVFSTESYTSGVYVLSLVEPGGGLLRKLLVLN